MDVITSKENGTVKHIVSLQRKKFRREYGEYLVEGWRSVTDSLATGRVRLIVVNEEVTSSTAAVALHREAATAGVRMLIVAPKIYKLLEETEHGQGVIAVVAQAAVSLADFRPTEYSLLVDRVQDPGNLGTILRTAVAAGFTQVLLTKGSVDPYNAKTVRSAMSAISKLAIYEQVSAADIEKLKAEYGVTIYATALEHASAYRQTIYKRPLLLMMGNEGSGLSDELFALADERITVPMYGAIESLNLAVATALCLFAIRESADSGKEAYI